MRIIDTSPVVALVRFGAMRADSLGIALVPSHTGKSIYSTPPQSPNATHIYDPFANPEDLPAIEEEADKKDVKHANGNHALKQQQTNNLPELKAKPELLDSGPLGREFSLLTMAKEKALPPLPARPSSRPSNPTPIRDPPPPELPARTTPALSKQRTAVPPPKVSEDKEGRGTLKYARDPQTLIAYLIPLPKPKLSENEGRLPERFLIYTPPQPHLLKPAKGVKEPKKHWCKRKLQGEVQKAEKYDGKTLSWRGLHSKTTKGVVWAIHRIKATDITEVDEIVLVYPNWATQTIPEVHSELIARVDRAKKRASKEAAISTILLPVTLAIDTVAVVIWPFGGLFEVDAVWAYASIKGWNTSRVITKRLGVRDSRLGKYGGTERDLRLRFHEDAELDMLRRYLADACHKKNPQMFPSAGVPPTDTEVRNAIGWKPVVRGSTGGARAEGETGWDDEEWQKTAFAADFKATMERGAISWGHWCTKFEKKPEKMLKK
ncbi:hypothetical protein JHW43_002236 [Diplocarpon mali]|nr:hypothetical protein JHW43_002236 [Diplocarpon mali]